MTSKSKYLSWLLRHGADEAGLAMDAAGWVAVADVLPLARLSEDQLDELVATNTKQRLQREGARIRCCQGHSTAGTPVTAGALEATWARYDGPDSLWHGTTPQACGAIAVEGLVPQTRTHVHLAPSFDSHVGKRHRVGVILEVSAAKVRAAGVDVFQSPNGVVLARTIPPVGFVGVELVSRRARACGRSWLPPLPARLCR